jgi:hypothetical protein
MANWLDKALGRNEAEPVKPVPFVKSCQCGSQSQGLRQERAKRVICAQCGAAHFILPVNPWPPSERTFFSTNEQGVNTARVPKRQPPKESPVTQVDLDVDFETPADDDDSEDLATDPEMDLVEEAWSSGGGQSEYADDDLSDDDGDDYELSDSDAEIELNPLPARRQKKKAPSIPASATSAATPEEPVVRRPAARETRLEIPSASDDRREQRIRIAAVSGLIVVVLGAMIAWNVRGRNRDRAEIAMREGRDIGEVALRNRDFATAREKLREAVEAMELLGIEETTQAQARQLWLQAEAGFGLLDSTDVVEIAMTAEETAPEDEEADDSDWQRRFRAQYFDRWLCIQLEPVVVLAGGEQFGKRVVFPAAPVIHLVGVDAVLDEQSGGRLWFAGPIKSCQRDPLHESAWLVEFDASRVIACDGSESLVRPMLTEEQQAAAMMAQAAESSGESAVFADRGDGVQRGADDD